MITLLPDHYDPDEGGSARQAAFRMESRAQEPASERMFQELVRPILGTGVRSVLELGCGTAFLSRRIVRLLNHANVLATDKSPEILGAARQCAEKEEIRTIQWALWDVLNEDAFPYKVSRYELVLSSLLIPNLSAEETKALIPRLVKKLENRGILAFIEQDLMSDSLHDPTGIGRRILEKEDRTILSTQGMGMRPLMRDAGLRTIARNSFQWVDERYGPYMRGYLGRLTESALEREIITEDERGLFLDTMDKLARDRDFYYSVTYHLIAAER